MILNHALGFVFQATAAFFEGVGRVTAVRISVDTAAPDSKNRAWVEFESSHAARDALDYSGKVHLLHATFECHHVLPHVPIDLKKCAFL